VPPIKETGETEFYTVKGVGTFLVTKMSSPGRRTFWYCLIRSWQAPVGIRRQSDSLRYSCIIGKPMYEFTIDVSSEPPLALTGAIENA